MLVFWRFAHERCTLNSFAVTVASSFKGLESPRKYESAVSLTVETTYVTSCSKSETKKTIGSTCFQGISLLASNSLLIQLFMLPFKNESHL